MDTLRNLRNNLGSRITSGFQFERGVSIVALSLLVLILSLVAYMAYNSKFDGDFPPVQSECPDYWTVAEDGKCINIHGLGECKDGEKPFDMDFNTKEWTDADGLRKKCQWAKDCNLTWDGITNNPKACNLNSKLAQPTENKSLFSWLKIFN